MPAACWNAPHQLCRMTDSAGPGPGIRGEVRPPVRTIVWAGLGALETTAALVGSYYPLPLDPYLDPAIPPASAFWRGPAGARGATPRRTQIKMATRPAGGGAREAVLLACHCPALGRRLKPALRAPLGDGFADLDPCGHWHGSWRLRGRGQALSVQARVAGAGGVIIASSTRMRNEIGAGPDRARPRPPRSRRPSGGQDADAGD